LRAALKKSLKAPKQNWYGLMPVSLKPSAICERASRLATVKKTSRSRQLRENLVRQVTGSSMPCRRLIIWCSCGWLSDVAFSTPAGSAIKAPGTSFQQSCSARTLTCSPTCSATGRRWTALTPRSPMVRMEGEYVVNRPKKSLSMTRGRVRCGELRESCGMLATQLGSRRPFVETQVFANALRWLCHAGLGTETETAFSNGLDASARPSPESDIQRARAIPASDKRFAKKGRAAGTQKRIGLNVPERSALLFSAHMVWAGCAYKGLSMVDRRASERVGIRYAILPRLSAYVRV
jgi:hypothetical protein